MNAVAVRRVGPRRDGRTCADGLPGHPIDQVKVVDRLCNYSAFSGYHWTPSDYSALRCDACNEYWRSKAAYVDRLPNA